MIQILLLLLLFAFHGSSGHAVSLEWQAPAPVAGSPSVCTTTCQYLIYRATGSGTFTVLNTSPQAPLTYIDTRVSAKATYSYKVVAVDPVSSLQSAPSNIFTVTVQ